MRFRIYSLAAAMSCLALTGVAAHSLLVPDDAPTISRGLAIAVPGDTVIISPGTYVETGLLLPDGVMLQGDADNPQSVVLDGFYGGRILDCVNLIYPAGIEGFTFTHGVSSSAAAVYCDQADVTIRHCIFVDNLSGDDGGALVCNEADVLIEDCRFENNQSNFGSGGAVTSRRANPTLRRCTFTGNSAFGWGGAFYYSGVDQVPVLEKCVFTDNLGSLGGAFAANGSAANLLECAFLSNRSRSQGGAFYVNFGADVLFDSCRFTANAADEGKAGLVGGGSRVELRCCEVDSTQITGGGLIVWNDAGCAQVSSETLSFGRLKLRYR